MGDYFQYISNLRICPNCGREACVEPHPQREDILIISCQNIECGYDFILVKEPDDFENIVVDTRKGEEVSKAVEGFLYNSTPDSVKEFLNYLSKQGGSTKETFTGLCLQWLKLTGNKV